MDTNIHSMSTKNHIIKIVRTLHLDDLFKSMKECWNDPRGGFLIPVTVKLTDPEYERYRHLEINWEISPITKDDLPDEFSPQAVKTVDMFRRKTFDLPYECMILFDYETGSIISCNFSDDFEDKVESEIYPEFLKSMHIASIHNHPIQYCSPPSSKNFQMLGLEFEEFELISSQDELWILKSNEIIFDDETIAEIRKNVDGYFSLVFEDSCNNFDKYYLFLDNLNKVYGDFLLDYLNNDFKNINLIRRYINE